MKPESKSLLLFARTRAKAKMYEYSVPEPDHINITDDPSELLSLTVGILGELAAQSNETEANKSKITELQESLRFAARYFDSYRQSHLAIELDKHLLLLGAASYYLCDFPGSSSVLSAELNPNELDLGARGLERLLAWLLIGNFATTLPYYTDEPYGDLIAKISTELVSYYQNGRTDGEFLLGSFELRRRAYDFGTPRELLLSDTIAAIVQRRYEYSSRFCLPFYSKLPESIWSPVLQKPTFVRELWPAQRLLGEKGVFEGASAVVQMPTSAGKSRATEIIIRSAFMSGRALLAVVVAPFRALCHEIRSNLTLAFQGEQVTIDELSDSFQVDFDINGLLTMRGALIVTPEKLLYVLRHAPELAERIGLLIYDEGHQFDTGTRGVTYELLITSLKAMLPAAVQTILISAVITNAEAIGNWLNGQEPNIVAGSHLVPTERTIAFTSWQDQLGRLEFVENDDPDRWQFFVPRVLESHQLQNRPKEKNSRFFPEKDDGKTIALYIGLKLVQNGSVAIFCGRKDTAAGLCEKLVEAYERGLHLNAPYLNAPLNVSDSDEVQRIGNLYDSNLGTNTAAAGSARLGVFTHHGNTPHGIRLAVEHAMKEGLARFVICTSTLAQGVNLPLRYLIVTSIYQGRDRIRTRDFHNLIGRVGRSGMHTEGSILFADPGIYDGKNARSSRWLWSQIKSLLRPDESEPCESTLLSIFLPLQSDNRREPLSMNPFDIPRAYVEAQTSEGWISPLAAKLARKGFSQADLEDQISRKAEILAAVESFLMAHWDDVKADASEEGALRLAEGTLAFHLASEENRNFLIDLFRLLASHVEQKAADPSKRNLFSRTLYGVNEALETEAWVAEHLDQLLSIETDEDLLVLLWPALYARIRNSTFRKLNQPDILKKVSSGWMSGNSFGELYQIMKTANVRIGTGKNARKPKVESAVEICENALGYDGALAVGAIIEIIGALRPEEQGLSRTLQSFQKKLKYGLPTLCAIGLYELGFSDRVIAIELSGIVGERSSRSGIMQELRRKRPAASAALKKYPSHFEKVFQQLLG